jgi:hypothetical protein
MMLNKVHFWVFVRDAAGSTTNTTYTFFFIKHFADVNDLVDQQQV